jgi:glycine/D-amino acid oxidase-like deaminating enzyme
MKSVWEQFNNQRKAKSVAPGRYQKDIVVVGGGIAGVMCAYMLSRSGHKVTLVEADKLVGGVTVNTTAHVNALQAKYMDIPTRRKRRLYFRSQVEAVNGIEGIIRDNSIDCDWHRVESFVFAGEKDLKDLGKEYKLLRNTGVVDGLEYLENQDFGFGVADAIKIGGQATFNPVKFLNGIIGASNFEIVENCRIKKVRLWSKTLKADSGRTFKYKKVIFATGFPIMNIRGLYAFKMYKSFSYALGIETEKRLGAIYNSIAGDGLTYRDWEKGVIVGGLDHRTSRFKCDDYFKALGEHAEEFGGKVTNKWAANDCMTFDGVPYAGRCFRFFRRNSTYMISGFGKWGMTNSFASAKVIDDMLTGQKNEFVKLFKPTRVLNIKVWGKVLINFLCDGLGLVAGLFSSRKKRCPHMGCRLKWNKSAKSWDCGCHGSRLNEKGEIIVSPAVDANKVIGKHAK